MCSSFHSFMPLLSGGCWFDTYPKELLQDPSELFGMAEPIC